MATSDGDLRQLRAAIDALAAREVPELLAQARREACARALAVLTDALTQSLLEQAGRELTDEPEAPPKPEPEPAAASPQPMAAEQPGAAAGSLGTYVYGVVAAADMTALPEPAGIDPAHRVETLPVDDLAALVSSVPLDEFNEHRLREHLSDMSWVERVARRHEAVLEAAGQRVTVIPMRLCSIYRDADSVRSMLQREAGAMRAALEELRGKAEWGVKAFHLPAADPAAGTEGDEPQTGAAYLERQRQARQLRERADEALEACCDSIHAGLCATAARAVLLALQRPEVSGHPGDMVLNAAYLVDGEQRDAFHTAVETLRAESVSHGVELELTGPWPAYNFVPDAIGAST